VANIPKKPIRKTAPLAAKPAPPETAPPEPVAEAAALVEDAAPADELVQLDVKDGTIEPAIETAAVTDVPAPAAEGTMIMTDVIETGKKFAADAKANVETVVAEFNEKAKAAAEKSARLFEEMGDLTKGNMEAIVESSKIAAKGVETLGQGAAEYGRKQFEKTSATMKSFASVKSPAEYFQLQSELLSGAFDAFASETSKNSEAMLKLVGDIAQPISTRVSIVTDKVKALAA
jgi:phasin family protein